MKKAVVDRTKVAVDRKRCCRFPVVGDDGYRSSIVVDFVSCSNCSNMNCYHLKRIEYD